MPRLRQINRPASPLTVREEQVMELVGQGLSYSEIGARLGIGRGTAWKKKDNALRKLRAADAPPVFGLSAREVEYLELVAVGVTYHGIAARYRCSFDTVRHTLERARQKLNARSAAHAIAVAYEHGILRRRSGGKRPFPRPEPQEGL